MGGSVRKTLSRLLVVVCLAAAAATALGAEQPPRLLREDVTAEFAVRPATMFFGCCGQFLVGGPGISASAFRSGKLGHIKWSKWTATQAAGTGLLWIDNCTPDCATGTFKSRSVSIHASRVRNGRYTRLLLVYRLNGHETVDRRSLGRLSGARTPAYQWF